MKKKGIICFLIASLFLMGSGVHAINVKVGLRFGNEAVYSFEATSAAGFEVGFARDGVFYKLSEVSDTRMYVEQGGGHYLMSAVSYDSLETAMEVATYMRQLGVYAHSGYINGGFYIMLGLFQSQEDAVSNIEWVKSAAMVDFVYTNMDSKTVMAVSGNNCFVFRNESDAFCFKARNGGTVKVSGKGEYRGAIMADRTYSKAVSVVNLVDMDDYLASVVGSEMYPSWHIEALKAQAVIARTYALTRSAYDKYGIDVTDDTRTQAYKGIEKETESTYTAAHETSGMVVKYNGKLADTYFCAMSGGKTANSHSAWGGADIPYLVSVDDIYEDVENIKGDIWQVKYTPAEIEAKLSAAGVNIGNVTDLTIAEQGADMRVTKLIISGTAGSHTLTFEKCRTFFNLKSQYYSISGGGTASSTASVLTASGISSVNMGNSKVLSASGISNMPESAVVKGAENKVSLLSMGDDIEFVFDGRGSGHGIGMSQYGAQGMAKAGFSYTDIIKFYFTGVTVEWY